jgi:hypothetical protein
MSSSSVLDVSLEIFLAWRSTCPGKQDWNYLLVAPFVDPIATSEAFKLVVASGRQPDPRYSSLKYQSGELDGFQKTENESLLVEFGDYHLAEYSLHALAFDRGDTITWVPWLTRAIHGL